MHRGALITVDQVVDDPAIKKELGLRYKALAVDMETAVLIEHANEKKIPFLSVRAFSDTVEQSLVNVSSFIDSNGRVSKLKAGWYAMTHPYQIKKLISLREQSQKASRNMTNFLEVFMQNYTRFR